jgi:pimeloyl-ACP methyl ester carboxylesterase
MHGTDDAMVPAANAPLIAGRIPGAVLELYAGGRHGFFEELADRVTPRVLAFL